jgi:hypothetical protein
MLGPRRPTTKEFERRIKKAEKDCEMRVKPGMSLPKYQKEFDRVLGAVDKYREMMKNPRKPAEQQLEDYHNWVQKIRKAKKIQMEAKNLVGSEIDEQTCRLP